MVQEQKLLTLEKKKCDDLTYSVIHKYMKDDTLKSLLESLIQYYLDKKKINPSFILTFQDFVWMFPRDSSTQTFNFKRQHVFESLCKILLCLNYDRDYWGKNKVFYRSLEKYIKGEKKELSKETIFNQKINEGSDAGSVDIFFKTSKTTKTTKTSMSMKSSKKEKVCDICDSTKIDIEIDSEEPNQTYILIQNKFYTSEYSSADKYDIPKILFRAKGLTDPTFGHSVKLVLMVNNKQELLSKISRLNNEDFSLIPKDDIFGCKEINDMFNELLYDIVKKGSIDAIVKIEKTSRNDTIQLRFHQTFIINVTLRYLKEGYKKFIWGAVPRSGKSYIIGGLIRERMASNVILFLGAKNETECQFVEMFCKYTDFDQYGIIVASPQNYKEFTRISRPQQKNIFIFSQELIKVNDISKDNSKFWTKYGELFGDKHLDIYFDEIHKGGTTIQSQEKILDAFLQKGFTIDNFTMVTATYAKPTIAYRTLIDSKSPIVINWSYEDQQNMKKISSDSIRKELLFSRQDIQKEELEKVFEDYQIRYHDQSLKVLEEDYSISPELVLMRGVKDDINLNISNDFNLKCSAIAKDIEEYSDPTFIFENAPQVERLLRQMGDYNETDDLSPDTIYGRLRYQYKYPIEKPHTQLWFLPYQNLYTSSKDCREERGGLLKKDTEVTGEESIEDLDPAGLPNIEPLIRGLTILLNQNRFFKEHFCFLGVYGQDRTPDFVEHTQNDCLTFSSQEKKKSIKQIIHECEIKAYSKGKSLIIMTGSMLRLGISIAHADIAFNFDRNKSVDLNYQTMFRVLTERPGKKFGFYYDFYPDRCQQFLYDYNARYTNFNGSKEEKMTKIISLLYLFKYDGLGIAQTNTLEQLSLYHTLIDTLELNEKTYNKYYRSDTLKIISSKLNSIYISDEIIEFIKKK